jgi:hypothetical protein
MPQKVKKTYLNNSYHIFLDDWTKSSNKMEMNLLLNQEITKSFTWSMHVTLNLCSWSYLWINGERTQPPFMITPTSPCDMHPNFQDSKTM